MRKLVDLSLLLPTDHMKNLQTYLSWETNEKEGKKSPFLKEKKEILLVGMETWKPLKEPYKTFPIHQNTLITQWATNTPLTTMKIDHYHLL